MPELAKWDNFYVIVGSAAGALIGLQFVVLTLIAQMPRQSSPEAGAAFGSPTVVHFGAALFLSALLHAPWQSVIHVAAMLAIFGCGGVIYSAIVIRRMVRQRAYKPVFEDWLFHAVLPMVAYASLALSAIAVPSHFGQALFGVAAASLLLLYIGLHNAWDAVSYHVLVVRTSHDKQSQQDQGK